MASKGRRRVRASWMAPVTFPGFTCEPQKAGYTTSFSSGTPKYWKDRKLSNGYTIAAEAMPRAAATAGKIRERARRFGSGGTTGGPGS